MRLTIVGGAVRLGSVAAGTGSSGTRGSNWARSRGPSTSPLAGMGSEIAIPVFGPLIVIGVVGLVVLVVAGRRPGPCESALLGPRHPTPRHGVFGRSSF